MSKTTRNSLQQLYSIHRTAKKFLKAVQNLDPEVIDRGTRERLTLELEAVQRSVREAEMDLKSR